MKFVVHDSPESLQTMKTAANVEEVVGVSVKALMLDGGVAEGYEIFVAEIEGGSFVP